MACNGHSARGGSLWPHTAFSKEGLLLVCASQLVGFIPAATAVLWHPWHRVSPGSWHPALASALPSPGTPTVLTSLLTPLGLQCWAGQLFPREGSCFTRCQLCLQLPFLWAAELPGSLYSKCDGSTAEKPTLPVPQLGSWSHPARGCVPVPGGQGRVTGDVPSPPLQSLLWGSQSLQSSSGGCPAPALAAGCVFIPKALEKSPATAQGCEQ